MQAVAMREYIPMVNESSTQQQATESDLARQAVQTIPSKVKELGGNDVQAQALADAMQLLLVGDEKQARNVLEKARYPKDIIDPLVGALINSAKTAA